MNGRFLWGLAALALLAAFLGFFRLGANSLHNEDEARYAIVVKNMAESGDLLTPTLDGRPYFRKPPLKFWLTLPLYRLFGGEEWVFRATSAAAYVGCVLVTALWGRRAHGGRAGLLAGLALATSVQFLHEHGARSGEMDTLLVLFWTGGLLAVVGAEGRGGRLLLGAALFGLACLTKNFVGVAPLLLAALHLAATGEWRAFPPRLLLLSAVLFAAIAFVWPAAMVATHGGEFLQSHVGEEVLQRISAPSLPAELQKMTFGMILAATGHTILAGLFPWSLLILPGVFAARGGGAGEGTAHGRESRRRDLLLLTAFLAVPAALLAFDVKSYWYLFPAYPPAAILAGRFLSEAGRPSGGRWTAPLAAVLALAALLFAQPRADYDPYRGPAFLSGVRALEAGPASSSLPAAALAFAALAAAGVLLARRFPAAAAAGAALLLSLQGLRFAAEPVRRAERTLDAERVGDLVQPHASPGTTVHLWRLSEYPPLTLQWYLARAGAARVRWPAKPGALGNALRAPGPNLVLTWRREFEDSREKFGLRFLGEVPFQNGRLVLAAR